MNEVRIVNGGRAYRLDLSAQRLFRENDDNIPITTQQWELLCYFLKKPEELLTKEQLFEAIWPGQVVSDDAIFRAVRLLRTALGDSATSPSFIETVHGRGYRFIAQIHEATSTEFSRHESGLRLEPYQWLPGDDPLSADLAAMNHEDVRQWLRSIGEKDRTLYRLEQGGETELYRYARDLYGKYTARLSACTGLTVLTVVRR